MNWWAIGITVFVVLYLLIGFVMTMFFSLTSPGMTLKEFIWSVITLPIYVVLYVITSFFDRE